MWSSNRGNKTEPGLRKLHLNLARNDTKFTHIVYQNFDNPVMSISFRWLMHNSCELEICVESLWIAKKNDQLLFPQSLGQALT